MTVIVGITAFFVGIIVGSSVESAFRERRK